MPAREHNCVRCLKYAMSWHPDRTSYTEDGEDLCDEIDCVPSEDDEPNKCKRCQLLKKPCIPGNRKIGRVLKSFDLHIRPFVMMSVREYEDPPTTKELRKKGRKALSAFRAAVDAQNAASAAAASEQRRSEHDAKSAAVSAEILATLVDIRNSLAIIANYGLPQAGTTQMPDDCTWDTSDDEDDN